MLGFTFTEPNTAQERSETKENHERKNCPLEEGSKRHHSRQRAGQKKMHSAKRLLTHTSENILAPTKPDVLYTEWPCSNSKNKSTTIYSTLLGLQSPRFFKTPRFLPNARQLPYFITVWKRRYFVFVILGRRLSLRSCGNRIMKEHLKTSFLPSLAKSDIIVLMNESGTSVQSL